MKAFHLAIAVDDLDKAVHFYGQVLGCKTGRQTDQWVDFNFFGHQLTCHQGNPGSVQKNEVDNDKVPVPHFGVIMPVDEWQELAKRLEQLQLPFILQPKVRFKGKPGEQATFFIKDPANNCLEFKAFANLQKVFSS